MAHTTLQTVQACLLSVMTENLIHRSREKLKSGEHLNCGNKRIRFKFGAHSAGIHDRLL